MSKASDFLLGKVSSSDENDEVIQPNTTDITGDSAWKYIDAGDISGFADWTNRNMNYRDIPFLGQLVGRMADAVTQGVADRAQFVGADGVSNYLNEKAQEGENYLPPMTTPELSLDYVTDPNGLASATGMLVGSMLSMAPETMLVPESAALKVGSLLKGLPKIGTVASEFAPKAVKWAATGPVEAAMEGGSTERQMLQNGATPEEAKRAAWNDFYGNVGLLTATNALEGGLLGKVARVKTPTFQNGLLNTASKIAGYAPATAAEAALQGYEEGAQQGIQEGAMDGQMDMNHILNPNAWDDEQWENAKFAVAGGLPLVGGSALIRRVGGRGNNATDSAEDLIAQAEASTQAKLAHDSAQAQTAEQATAQPAFAVAEPEETQAQESASTDFDAGTYDMPTQGDAITAQVQNLKSGWQSVLPQIGGVLHNQFGLDGVISSAARTPEHNAEVGGAEHSHHIDNGDGGDAVDIVLPDGTTAEQAEQVKQYFENSGAFQEVLFHDAGSGYHLHLGGLKGSLGDAGTSAGSSVDVSNLPYGNIAMAISQRTGIPAQFVWAQMAWETGDFSSGLSVDDHNYGGIKQSDGSYRHFDSDEDYIDYASKNLNAYKENGIGNARTIDEFAAALKDGGYFTDDLGHYTEGLKSKLAANGLPESGFGGSGRLSSSTNFLNEKSSFDINSDDAEGRKMIADFIDYWGNRANVDDADTIQGMLDANGKFRNTQENRDTVREKWGDELQQYADEHMTDEQQAGQETKVQKQAQQQADAARRAAQGGKKAASVDNTKATIDTSTPNLDAAKQQQVSTTPQATSIDTAGESEQTQAEPAQSLPNTAHLQPNTEHPASETAHPATAAQAKAQQAQPTTQASQPTAQAAPIEQAKAPNVPKNEPQNAQQNSQAPAQPQTPTMDAQQATKQQNALPQPAQTSQQATAQMSPAQQRARAAKEQRLQKELETNATLDQIERGQQLEAAAKQAGVTLPQGMAGSLHRGQAPAIAQATELLQQKGVSLPTVEASGSTVYGKSESNNGWGSTERARFHRKLKKARAGLKKQKPKSKDERELVNSIDKAYQDIQDALEGLKNGTMSAKDAGHLIWKRHGEVASKWQNTKNKKRYLGTRGAYENAFNDATTEVHYASVEAGEDNSRSTEEPTVDPVTSKQVMQGYRDAIDETVDDYYKGELTAEESHIEMERTLEKAQGEPESRAREEDQQAFDEYVTQKENEVAEDNRQKLDGHIRDLLRKGQKPFEEETKTPDTAATNVEAMAWIDAHPFRYDKNKSVDENIERGEAYARAFIKQFGTTDQIDTPERQALRERIADELYGKGAKKKEGKVWLIVGVPASGKSTIANPIQEKNGAMLIDADEAKEKLPEFAGGLLAGAVHEESSNIVSDVLKHAIEQKDNIVMPVVGKTYESLKHKIDRFKEAGYEVHLEYVDLPVEKATQRVKSRFVETGRLVSPKYLASVGLKPKENYDKLKVTEEVDSYEAWNNDVERGAAPLLIERSSQSKPQNSSGLGGRRDDGRSVRQGAGLRDRESEAEASNRVKPNTESRSEDQGGFSLAHLAEKAPVGGAVGKAVTVVTDKKTELHARYRIVPASSLTTSNVYDGDTIAKNDAYPQELQPRERSGRKEMQAQTDGMAADLHPADLEASRNLNQGAPLIRSDGVVLNGNGRTMAITRAYALRNKAGKRYTQYLIEHAEDFGFTKDQMRAAVKAKGTGKPVLVRELTDDADEATTQDIINSKTGGARMSATEQAETDAKSITSRDFDGYDAESDGDLTKAGNDGFVAKLLRKLVGKDEINAYTDANGSVNQDGYRRVKRAIFSRAYGDTDLIAKMAESMDDAIKNISNGLQSAAANVARLNLKMQEGDAYSYPLADTIARAVKKYNAIKEGKAEANVEAYTSENATSLTGGDPEEVVKMVQALDDYHRSGKKVGIFLNRLARLIDGMGSPKEDENALFVGGEAEPRTLAALIDRAKELTDTKGEQNLFGTPKYSIAYHGTAADFDKFDVGQIGTGEGSQAHGWGLYFAKDRSVSEGYKSLLVSQVDEVKINSETYHREHRDYAPDAILDSHGKEVTDDGLRIAAGQLLWNNGDKAKALKTLEEYSDLDGYKDAANILRTGDVAAVEKKGTLAEVEVPEDDVMLDEQKTLDKQPETVREALSKLAITDKTLTGKDAYEKLSRMFISPRGASRALNKLGVKGIKYHGENDGDCYVVFDDKAVSIIRKLSASRAKEAHARSVAELRREIASAFPGAKNVREDSDHIAFTMPNGSHLEIWTTDNIELSSEEEAQAKRDHGVTGDMHIKVNGYEVTVGKDAIIALSKAGEKGTAYHEVLHIAMDILFSDREKAALAKKFGKGRGTVEEHIAEAFRRYKLAREYGAHVPFGKLFQRIQDFFANLADHYKELRGTMTDADVARRAFRELANGKAWERDASVGRGARKYAGGRGHDAMQNRAANANHAANADENPLDFQDPVFDNVDGTTRHLLEKHMNVGIRKIIHDKVAEQIGTYVNLEDMNNPAMKDEARDTLPYIKKLLRDFNTSYVQDNPAYKDRLAVKIEYARRCFDYDQRIQDRLGDVRPLDGHGGQGGIREVGNAAVPRGNQAGNGQAVRGVDGGVQARRGVSNNISPHVARARKHFLKLYDEASKKHYSVSRSDSQGGFSRAQNPRKYSIAYHGTQHEFDKFDVGKIGRGEGTRVHGWGIYFAKNREVSQKYRDTLAGEPHGVTINGTTYHYEGGNLFTADGKRVDSVPIRLAVDTLVEEGSRKAALARAEGAAVGILDDEGKKNWAAVRDLLKGAKTQFEQDGMLAEANVPEDGVMLDEQKPFDQQPKNVQDAVNSMLKDLEAAYLKKGKEASSRAANGKEELLREGARNIDNNERANDAYENLYFFMDDNGGKTKGQEIYDGLCAIFGGDKNASIALNEYGVKGIKYKGERDGDCYVVFDDKAVSIIRKLSASRAKEAHARAIEDIKAEVMKAFPGAKDVKDTEGRITFTMPNGAKVAIRIHDNMTVTGEEASRARRAHGIADGVTITVNGSEYTIGRQAVIDLSQRGEVGTVYHEALHVAMDLLFDDKTKAALMKKYGSEEKIADAYRKFMLAEARGGHVPFGKPLRAIRDFFRALAAHIAPIRKACGDAWTAQKAFEDLASGKAWQPAAPKKSHSFSIFSHAEAAERPIDNEAARGDNEGEKSEVRKLISDERLLNHVKDTQTVEQIREMCFARDKRDILRMTRKVERLIAAKDPRAPIFRKVLKRIVAIVNQHRRDFYERDNIERLEEGLRRHNKGREGSRLAESLSEVRRHLDERRLEGLDERSQSAIIPGEAKSRHPILHEIQQELTQEEGMEDARKTGIEPAHRIRTRQDVAGLHSWRDIEASSRKHHGGAAFTEHPAEVNHEQHHSVSRSETQDGFSDARKSDEEYLAAVDRYENAKTDEERAHALDDLRMMVQEAADAAGFHDAVPEQTVAYHTREGAAPKKTIKVYKVFTVSPDGSPTALFIGGTEKLPQGVWLDAQSAYHFQAANGKYYVPSTQNPYTKGGKTGSSVEIPNEQVRQELIERGFLKPGSTAKKITALAYRPGWHAGTLPFFPQGGKKDASANYGMVHRENQVVFECELAADKNYTQEARSQEKAKTKAGKLNLKNADLQYMPENGFYFYATNPLTQSHPELGAWAISGSLKINRALSQEECDRILEKNGMKPQAWEQGKMNLQDLGYTGEQNDAARKTLAPITYDDSGNVIPLSERFNPEKHDIRYSITPEEKKAEAHTRSWFKSLGERFSKAYHLKSDKVINDLEKSEAEKTEAEKQKEQEQLRATDRIHSPHVVASRLKTFRVFYVMGDRAMNKLVSLRNQYSRKLTDAYDLVKDKDDKDALFDLLLRGDTEGKEWKKQELLDEGVKENVADAYIKIRRLMTKAYHMVNNARRHPVPKTENVTQEQLDFIRQSKFTKNIDDVVDLGISSKDHMHHYRVSYTQYRHYERTHENITGDMLAQYRKDPGIDVLEVKEVAADADGRPLYNVKVQEGPADMNRLTGYIPHFFHDYFLRVLDENGKVVATIGSGRTQRDAIIKGEEWLKGHKLAKGQTLHVQPKVFDFGSVGMDEHQYAAVMGDMDFYRMTNALAKENDMTLEEARAMLDGKVRLKGRHRFFGNALHRRGVEGYETDLNWVLTHYFNSASRYAAMETEFKPKAISAFERFFGRFDDDYADNDMARICKRFINNINGNPSTAEEFISKLLNSTTLFKKYIIPTFGDRSALTLGNGIANKVSYLTLGLNMSSALLNFSQLVNSAAYIGEIGSLVKMVKEGTKRGPSLAKLRDMQKRATSAAEKERIEQQIQERLRRVKILQETGVYNDIGLDSGSGYDQARMGAAAQGRNRFTKALYGINVHMDSLGNKSMFFFQHADAICRRGTVLAAYEKARREGKTHAQAIAYAKEINVKANFIYGVQDTPDLFQRGSIISQLALQFKKFGLKELEVMADFMPDFPGLRKLGSYDNIHLHKYSAKQKAMFWGMFFLMSGLMGVPALDWLDDLFANLLPKAFGTDPHSTKDFFTKLIVENIHNKALAKAMLYGASGVFNINLSSRAGLSDVIPSSMGDFAGPTLSKGARLVKDYNENNWPSMLRDVSPGMYNLYAAYAGESRGKRDRLNDRYVTAWDRILRAVGFRSVDETIPTDMQRIISRDKAAATKERQEAQDAYIQNPTSENKQRLKDLGIKEKDVQKEATKKNQTREERTQGTVPKKDKDKYKPLTDFMKE